MPEKIATFGAKLYKTTIAAANEIASVISVGGIDISRAVIDSSTHDDTVKTKLAGIWDSGDLTVRIAFDPQDYNHIMLYVTDTAASTPNTAIPTWIVTVKSKADGTKKMSFTFTGFIKNFKIDEFPTEGMMTAELVFEISGVITIAPDNTNDPDA